MSLARLLLPILAGLALPSAQACGPQAAPTKTATPEASPRAEKAPLGDAKSGFALVMGSKTIGGETLSAEARPTAIVVFASWCGPCRQELATLGELRQQFPTLRVIGINAYEDYGQRSDQERLRKFLSENAPWLKQIVHADRALLRGFGNVPNIPTLFVYDESGAVVAEFRRNKRQPPSHQELEAAIASAVASQPSQE